MVAGQVIGVGGLFFFGKNKSLEMVLFDCNIGEPYHKGCYEDRHKKKKTYSIR